MLLLSPQQGQYVGQFSDTRLLLTYVFTSNLNPHLYYFQLLLDIGQYLEII